MQKAILRKCQIVKHFQRSDVAGVALSVGLVAGVAVGAVLLGAVAGIAGTIIVMKKRHTSNKGNVQDGPF